jgi:hypothetical protein
LSHSMELPKSGTRREYREKNNNLVLP